MFNVAQPTAVALPGETVRWTGRPPTGLRLRRTDALAIPFSLFWGGFSFFWESSAINNGAPWFFVLFGVPFVLVGIYLIVGRFFVDAALRARTTYVVTDRAAYVSRAGMFSAVRRFAESALDAMQFEPSPNGSGTIRFTPQIPIWQNANGTGAWSLWNNASLDAFQDIADAQHVYELVLAARSA